MRFTMTDPKWRDKKVIDPNNITDEIETSATKSESQEKSLSLSDRLKTEERTNRVASESLGVQYFDQFLSRDSGFASNERISESLGAKLTSFVESENKSWDSIREIVDMAEEDQKEVPDDLELITADPPPNRTMSSEIPPMHHLT
eukprot:TRINITY_DN4461_c0_g1_i1.p1 TRINITY_DN4461_c0_g1~~TRINITY_DN4461_c0_g1_i1.p1  ORF type:complete len:145 (+),score=23.64 TRINITY_DN4461_c0_g1_i1:83-517(+)